MRFSYFLFVFLIIGCSCNNNLEHKLYIEINKNNSENIIAIKNFTDFEWNKFYVFYSATSIDEINKVLGFDYPYYREFSKIFVFLYNGKIVYHEENRSSVESVLKNEIIFGNGVKYEYYNPQNAIFKVKKHENSSGFYFELIQIKG